MGKGGYNKEGCLCRVHGDLILYAPVPDLFAVKEKRNHKDWFPFCYFRNVYSIS